MHRFEQEEPEPVAVVRTLSDFALALTLIVLMLIGTRSAAGDKRAEAQAARAQPGDTQQALHLLFHDRSSFIVLPDQPGELPLSGEDCAANWRSAHPDHPATIVLHFPDPTLAKDLHRALLELQSAFGTNLTRIETVPQS